ncbi:hypothetical protein [Streptomyces bobili]|uniref:DUF4145 domain-containing protein n=1 Tax=Streptomyces bobili TaxID=67280 RepID=A0ABZ1QXF9_9ACTN|nr:hypothetical protein [Streptomyces bobili]
MDDALSFESLLSKARHAAQKAMDDHARGEYDEFALHGGVAFERLAKAVLVSKNPAYLVEMRNGNSDMLLYLCGDLELKADKVRTVGASEAIKRLRRMKVLPEDAQLDQLIDLRNGTAHTTIGDQAKALLPTLAENVEALLKHLGQPLGAFWGRWTSAVHVAVDEERDEIQRDVEIRIKQARHLFDDRFKGLPEGAKERILKEPHRGEGMLIGPITMKNGDKILFIVGSVPCPACGGKASMTLTPITQPDATADMAADSFQCHLCGLELNNPIEIRAAGVDTDVALLPSTVSIKQTGAPSDVRIGETRAG